MGTATDDRSERLPKRRKRQRSAWRERVLARVAYLEAQLDHQRCAAADCGCRTCRGEQVRNRTCAKDDCRRRELIEGARACLAKASAAATERHGWLRRLWSGATALEGSWSNVRSADVLLVEVVPAESLPARAVDILAMARLHLGKEDLRTVALAARVGSKDKPIGEADRSLLVRTLDAGYAALDAEYARVRSLRNILWAASACVMLGVICLAVFGAFFPKSLSLCFSPVPTSGPAQAPAFNLPGPSSARLVVCPSGEYPWVWTRPIPGDYASRLDIITVEVAGLAGAALTVIGSLRRIQGTSAPFMLPLAAAALKFPTGALTAVIGLLLIRGAFVPGLSDLDSRAQVLAWGVAFGAAQHLVTRLVDIRAQSTLDDVGKPPGDAARGDSPAQPRAPSDRRT
ncbi:hypothetical protein [Kitasatospora purpeofusca]|uniref:hypothetical protein n=1 Tax=Kitasatospora purpeofusca TaxID=67352 RepID=UPI0036D41B64